MTLTSPKTLLTLGLTLVGLTLAVIWLLPTDDAVPARAQEPRRADRPKRIKEAKPAIRRASVTKPMPVVEDNMSPADKKLCADIQGALDGEDKAAVRGLVKEALKSENPEVRKAMVDALGWFGKGVIGDLAVFLADKDAEVRELAGNNWQIAVSELDDETTKAIIVEETLKTVNDENLTDMIASEYNGMDEKAAIESICKVIASGNAKGVKAAKEAYEFVTGEEWVSTAQARAWLKENYTPPDAD